MLDWHTQHSTQADSNGLISKLKRLMPIVGCEADAVAFEEEERRSLVALPEAPHEAKTVHHASKCRAEECTDVGICRRLPKTLHEGPREAVHCKVGCAAVEAERSANVACPHWQVEHCLQPEAAQLEILVSQRSMSIVF